MAEVETVPRDLFDSEVSSLRRDIASLEKLLGTKIESVEDAAKLALDAADKASAKADSNFEKRMDTTNEWRGALEDQAKDKASVQQVDALKEQVSKLEAAYNRVIGMGIAFGAASGLVAGVASRWIGA